MKNEIRLRLVAILGAFMMAGLSAVYAVSCGDVLASGGTVVLGADLTCSTDDPVLTVTNGTKLDLNGHTVSCDSGNSGIFIDGAGSVLKNGTITGGCFRGVILEGTGGHLVRNVKVTNSDIGIESRSDGNVIEKSKAIGIAEDGFIITGNNNWLINNLAQGNDSGFYILGSNTCLLRNKALDNQSGLGFDISSDHNQLLRNVSKSNTNGSGFGVSGDNNWLVRNNAKENERDGIGVSGEDNRLIRNRAKDNEDFDLADSNPGCDGNIWKKNLFGTRNPAGCIE